MTKKPSKSEQLMLGQFEQLSAGERARFLDKAGELNAAILDKARSPWPRVVKLYAHQSKESGWHHGEEIGLDLEKIGGWCPLYEICITGEVQEDGEVKFLALDGFMIDYDRPYKGPIYTPPEDK